MPAARSFRWSWRIFRIAGINVYVHFTFVLLLIILPFALKNLLTIILLLAVFGCVLLHELGHALTARIFGIQTRDITLLPIGGVAQLERIPREPVQELLITVAGPAVNLVLAGIFLILAIPFDSFETLGAVEKMEFTLGDFLANLFLINGLLFLFNLIPAFPMDGGRILRALLAMKLDYLQATQLAARIGQALAVVLGLIGLFLIYNPFLVLIAIFVYFAAGGEAAMVERRHHFQGCPTASAMITDFHSVGLEDPIERAVEHMLRGSQTDFPVLRDGEVVGVLTRDDLLRSLGAKGRGAAVKDVPFHLVGTVDADEPLEKSFDSMQRLAVNAIPVIREGNLVGLLTQENLFEFSMVRAAVFRRFEEEAKARAERDASVS